MTYINVFLDMLSEPRSQCSDWHPWNAGLQKQKYHRRIRHDSVCDEDESHGVSGTRVTCFQECGILSSITNNVFQVLERESTHRKLATATIV
jgi:hypothetical protein